jgi:suppressor of G2 allele of SKP1
MSEEKEETLVLNAKKDFLFDDFENAIIKIDLALSKFGSSPSKNTYIIFKATCKYKLGKYEEALKDLDVLEKDESFKKDFNYFLTRGKVLFYLSKFVDCKMTLNNALHLISSTDKESLNLLTPWLNKADVELKEGGVINYNVTNVGELKIIYNWIQTGTNITVDITSNHNLNAYDIKINKKSIEFIDKKEGTLKYTINLTNGILPDKSSYKITSSMKCKLELHKEVENFNWVNLEVNKNDDSLNNPKDKVVHGYYPSSSKVKKDWRQLDKENDEQEKEDASKDGNEGMWRLFRDIYAKGNEETRRAMIKSFQTSGGTVLSTNWDEVKDKDYEGKDRPEAPKGQEWATPPKK